VILAEAYAVAADFPVFRGPHRGNVLIHLDLGCVLRLLRQMDDEPAVKFRWTGQSEILGRPVNIPGAQLPVRADSRLDFRA